MNVTEFKNQFLLEYDTHHTNRAPGMTDYMISYWLTRAQEDLVKNLLSTKSNRKMEGFEGSETRRRRLSHLLRSHVFTTPLAFNGDINFNSNSKRYDVSSLRILEIKAEWLSANPDVCDGADKIKVIPVTHDELLEVNRNPFRKPNRWRAWRLDLGSDVLTINSGFEKPIEIVSSLPYLDYRIRYVFRPHPIIVGDLTLEDPSLSIDGENNIHECELDQTFHNEIVARAVTYALETTMNPRFQSAAALEALKIE